MLINKNEIHITTQGRMHSYITYATSLIQEKGSDEIIFKAMGRTINKTVMIVELIDRRIADLHQNTAVGSTDITDTWEPLEEGLLPLETTRHVSMIKRYWLSHAINLEVKSLVLIKTARHERKRDIVYNIDNFVSPSLPFFSFPSSFFLNPPLLLPLFFFLFLPPPPLFPPHTGVEPGGPPGPHSGMAESDLFSVFPILPRPFTNKINDFISLFTP
ncbi:hypothetical protein KSP40_PGU018245 [Platanthera guangdongensis]|uniref:DNA/RNA-binding protein Alba-like domain-containing protein n=1 Tax=Platanthera guangdongensis TaxID=2320717 RepID=A0ABR2M4V5_9ASPA